MFFIDNQKIGKYIGKLIDSKFNSSRQFCAKYLEKKNDPYKDDSYEIQKTANRLIKIKKGETALQIDDLPAFSELLGVSIENLLSAGKCNINTNNLQTTTGRHTNYSIAQSHAPKEWDTYIKEKDNPILNTDEYEKTVIDYAIEAKNYDFIQYLIKNKYIWFDCKDINSYVTSFGAGTNIPRTKYPAQDLQYRLATRDQLRLSIISLAIDHDDITMLDELRARELPELYSKIRYPFYSHPDFRLRYDDSMVKLVEHISVASDKVISYFSSSFEIREQTIYKDGSSNSRTFMFPYISVLLDIMIVNNSPCLKDALKKSISHNSKTFDILSNLTRQSSEANVHNIYAKDDFNFSENGNIISFYNIYEHKGTITNIVNVTKMSSDSRINELINKLNESYRKILNIFNK